jgi:hypothetical protein
MSQPYQGAANPYSAPGAAGGTNWAPPKQDIEYLCAGMFFFLSVSVRLLFSLLIVFNNQTVVPKTRSGLENPFDAESVAIESCTRRGRGEVRAVSFLPSTIFRPSS